ncbi:MAG: hypothetical protein SFW67_16775 [Myxococcaceae bacterium]|nr:hypothetical protein [Myxococcaceae bacterium]
MTEQRPPRRARRPRWLFVLRAVAIALVAAQLSLLFAPDRFVGFVRLPVVVQFLVGLAVLGAVVVEVLAAAGGFDAPRDG